MIVPWPCHDVSLKPMVAILLIAGTVAGCQSEEPPPSYVARVGDQYLREADVSRMLEGMGPAPDTTQARQQIIEQWVTRTLLYREAVRLNLASVEEVQRKLQQQRRSVLITAMTDRLYERSEAAPSEEEVRTYFEGHKDQWGLREPYVRVRYLTTDSWASAQAVRQRLASEPVVADSAWAELVQQHATSVPQAERLSDQFLPESRLVQSVPLTPDQIANLDAGEIGPLLESAGVYHVLKVIDRVDEGSEPELEWFEDQIRRRLQIRARKQTYTREVQRLRSKARANGALDVP